MRSYSLDLRERVVRALQNGMKQKQVAEQFDVSLSSVQRFAYLHRTQGHLRTKPHPGRKTAIGADQGPELLRLLTQEDTLSLPRLAKTWQERTGKPISTSTIYYAVKRLGYSYKKNEVSP